jgi:hypothetical protein
MRPPSEQSQHARSIFRIARFTKNEIINRNNRIRPENKTLRIVLKNRQRLLPRQPLSALRRRFTGKRRLINVSRLHRKQNSGVAQQLLAPRRSRGKHNSHKPILSEYSPSQLVRRSACSAAFLSVLRVEALNFETGRKWTGSQPVKIKNHAGSLSQAAASCRTPV